LGVGRDRPVGTRDRRASARKRARCRAGAGRDAVRLAALASKLGGAKVVSGSLDSLLAQIRAAAPAVVVNTVGPFARTSALVIAACRPGTHYVDIGNELSGVQAVLDGHQRAVTHGSTIVTGAGFGVLATESAALRVCQGRPAPTRLRVDAIPSLATEDGVIGAALASSMLDGAPEGGRRVEHGRLSRFPVAGARQHLTTPTGDTVTTAALPTGDLSPHGGPVAPTRSSPPPQPSRPDPPCERRFRCCRSCCAGRRCAGSRSLGWPASRSGPASAPPSSPGGTPEPNGTTAPAPRRGCAWATQHFTETTTAEIARRLAGGRTSAGAYTPGALFGAALAADIGAEFV